MEKGGEERAEGGRREVAGKHKESGAVEGVLGNTLHPVQQLTATRDEILMMANYLNVNKLFIFNQIQSLM